MALADYLISYLGKLNNELGYVVNDFSAVVSDTLVDYGVSTEADATDSIKLYALAKVNLWQKVMVDIAGTVDFNADGASYKNVQFYEHVVDLFTQALNKAIQYLPQYQIEVGKLETYEDPYKSFPPYFQRYK